MCRLATPIRCSTYPWLKCHGSIEALKVAPTESQNRSYPWLKCHGSIEAQHLRPGLGRQGRLSMAKMPWLH